MAGIGRAQAAQHRTEANMFRSKWTRREFTQGLMAAGGILLTGAKPEATFSLRQYHNQPEESPLHKRLVQMWAAVKTETGGNVEVQIFPENNHFKEGDPDPLAMLLRGDLDFYTNSGNGLASLVPAANIQATPFAFRTPEQVYSAMDGDLGEYLRQELMAKGLYFIPTGSFENGFHQITCSSRPIRTADDMKGLKIRAPGSAIYLEFWKALGAVPVSMNINSLYAGLKAGTAEAQEDPLDVIELFKLYEVQKNVSMTNHSWSGYNLLANLKLWQRLPEDIQGTIRRNAEKFVRLQRTDTDGLNNTLRAELIKQGMMFNETDIASFRGRLGPFYEHWKESVGEKAWNLLEAHVGKLS
jgi:tripartite ATP-independent transporter DctP family solute receptor